MTGDRLWPAGEQRLHLYLLPRLDTDQGLAALMARCAQVLSVCQSVAVVPSPWLHSTVLPIRLPATQISASQLAVLTGNLRRELASTGVFSLVTGSPVVGQTAVVLDQDGDGEGGPFRAVWQACHQAAAPVFGAGAVSGEMGVPHMTVAYGTGPDDSGRIASALRRQVRPSHAAMSVSEVHLVRVNQDPAAAVYHWEPVAVFPLG
jgi:hypothetical protein